MNSAFNSEGFPDSQLYLRFTALWQRRNPQVRFWVSVVISNLHSSVICLQSGHDLLPTVCLALASCSACWTLVPRRARGGYKPLSTWHEESLASPDQTNPLSAPPDSLLLTCSLAPAGLGAPHLNLSLIYARLCCEPTCLVMLFMW